MIYCTTLFPIFSVLNLMKSIKHQSSIAFFLGLELSLEHSGSAKHFLEKDQILGNMLCNAGQGFGALELTPTKGDFKRFTYTCRKYLFFYLEYPADLQDGSKQKKRYFVHISK